MSTVIVQQQNVPTSVCPQGTAIKIVNNDQAQTTAFVCGTGNVNSGQYPVTQQPTSYSSTYARPYPGPATGAVAGPAYGSMCQANAGQVASNRSAQGSTDTGRRAGFGWGSGGYPYWGGYYPWALRGYGYFGPSFGNGGFGGYGWGTFGGPWSLW